ncbi:1,4-alpha-glucan branching protein GlgB [Rhodopila sp.]|uniref:1,4-alpha-glucan branching protein GlgB n=1 Tax=Rhodopila sp. TaxID=2480087 RepID=UPI002B8E94FD|nr:1,4-alpha-glucan branching protein GlgB [Rhodopila sp.]HVZ10047.1 1,4-alpha-glucan branching protein GlgB [Rhodopila sp.]
MLDVADDFDALTALEAGRHGDPFALLGLHDKRLLVLANGARGVEAVSAADGSPIATLHPVGQGGLFMAEIAHPVPYRLRIDWAGVIQETEDPYSFGLLLGDLDLHLIAEGRHRDLARCLGAHVTSVGDVDGVRFAVWAPNAARVSVVGDFNAWDGRRHPMRNRPPFGVWELFIPRLRAGERYKFELLDRDWRPLPLKADPVGLQAEPAPATASVVPDPTPFVWTDEAWLEHRSERQSPASPIAVYEVHASSWIRVDGRQPDWEDLAERLIPYVVDMGFTHIEFLPIMSHPFGGSWGYQPLGQFAPQGSLGPPRAFARFVDRCHEANLGVILDWVPAHFPTDAYGLARFDGTPLYEHADPREGFHHDWNTLIYNHGRHEVRGFLIASALFWLEHYHVDGLRVDAVASMLYRDYSRREGEWIPNMYGGRENLEAISFLQELNTIVAERCPGTLMIAEESTAWPGVTAPAAAGGLGFSFKWNMGWMHDTLDYLKHDPIHRRHHHHEMTFGMIYAYSEKFMLPLSHDEVVHGKGSLYRRMPGDEWRKCANLRAYFGFMWGHPGKQLLFMGGEFAQQREWDHDSSLDWHLLDNERHRGVQRLLRDLNRIYASHPALYAQDTVPSGFRWVVGDDAEQSVFAFLRFAAGAAPVLVVSNFTPVPRYNYRIGVPHAGRWRECINSDATSYGGAGMGNSGQAFTTGEAAHGLPDSLVLTLPPLATLMLTVAT